MKLEKILDNLNSLEKNSFIKIVDSIISGNPKKIKSIEKILVDTEKGLKSVDNVIISKIFDLLVDEFNQCIQNEFVNATSQLDILTDIIIRDGNCIMKQDWFARLYEFELKNINKKIKELDNLFKDNKSDISEQRKRDYKVYKKCLETAYYNDIESNRETKITDDELSILLTLSRELELSQEEVKLINYMIITAKKLEIETIITELKNLGVIFYSKKNNTIYVADEVVRVLRKIRGKEVADKFFRRVLRLLREPQINLIAKMHNIDRKLSGNDKIKEIINEGVSLSGILSNEIYKENTNLNDKKKFVNELCDKGLNIQPALKGVMLDEKIKSLITHFESIEKDEKVGISIDGYENLLLELGDVIPQLNNLVKSEFQLQEENVLKSGFLLDFNIKPRDVLEVLSAEDLEKFIKIKGIKTRGNDVLNILSSFKDSENLYIENFENIGFRDLNALKENGIKIKEADLGLKFEEITKSIFSQLGFNVDEKLKKQINTKKDKIDILINLGNNELILVECKTIKESGYNKFSSVSRQMKSYIVLAEKNNYSVIKSLLIAPDFSDDFVNDTELEYDLNLSLITASSLLKILEGFKNSRKHKQFPFKLLMRDVLIKEDRIVKAMSK
jgi:ribosomal protein S15P/S13E